MLRSRTPPVLPPSALPALSEPFLDREEVVGVALPSLLSLLALPSRTLESPAAFPVLVFISDSHTGALYNGDFSGEDGGASACSSRGTLTGAGAGVGVGLGLGGAGLSTSLLLESRTILELRRGRNPMGA